MKNPLLIKDEIGKHRASTYHLPPADFRYGKPDVLDAEGAKEITMHWKSHDPSQGTQQLPVANFQAINKAASGQGRQALEKAKELKQKGNLTISVHPKISASSALPKGENLVFGKPTRLSTPIADIVKNKFGLLGEKEHRNRVAEISHAKEIARRGVEAKPTKASDACAKRRLQIANKNKQEEKDIIESDKQPFKMKKFLNIPAKLVLPGK